MTMTSLKIVALVLLVSIQYIESADMNEKQKEVMKKFCSFSEDKFKEFQNCYEIRKMVCI